MTAHFERGAHAHVGIVAAGGNEIEVTNAQALHLGAPLGRASLGDVLQHAVDADALAALILWNQRAFKLERSIPRPRSIRR